MSNTLHPSDGIVISKKWIEGEIERLSNLRPNEISLPPKEYTQLHLLRHILQFHSQPLKPVLEEKEAILNAVSEGADNWKQEYDECRKILIDLCALKKEKDSLGKTDHYLEKQPEAWKNAFEFIVKYQHFGE